MSEPSYDVIAGMLGHPWGQQVVIPVYSAPDPEWTVEADGWKLIIRDGAMVGLERKP